jgi:hypothetical protein
MSISTSLHQQLWTNWQIFITLAMNIMSLWSLHICTQYAPQYLHGRNTSITYYRIQKFFLPFIKIIFFAECVTWQLHEVYISLSGFQQRGVCIKLQKYPPTHPKATSASQTRETIQCKTHPSKQWWDDVWDWLLGVVCPHKWRRWLLLRRRRQFAGRRHLGGRLLAGGHHRNILLHLLWLAELLEQHQLHFLITQFFTKLAQPPFTLCKLCWWQFLHNSFP